MRSLAPALGVRDAEAALSWYEAVFGAREVLRLTAPDGTIVHAEVEVEGCLLMLGEESPDQGSTAPPSLGGTPVRLHLYVDDAEALASRAVERGAELLIPVEKQFYGDLSGRFRDPFGHVWIVATRVEEVSPEEMQARMDRLFGG
ncbi:MAG: VOC family protein [Gemmatimonadetes bacterium]|nr:VOC family protein [Gemmatimonadota bacterium]NIR80169.1 VOC family protein [Gemmatimonadota bacterium]NIT88932.1 VOC family protein [Gemmatimonadota bacterium]NIU32725.1 VOC family protein [Gemmatimonadota bacterium]NIU37160.1 VOC family protein [Gemmatimonadota bacterium]